MNDFCFTIPTKIYAGRDCSLKLGGVAAATGERTILVADSLLARSPILATIDEILKDRGIESITCPQVEAGATAKAIEGIMRTARAARCQTVIGIGGIRTLSAAKCVAAFAASACHSSQDGDSSPAGDDTLDPYLDGKRPTSPPLAYIGIPTSCRDPFACTSGMLIVDPRNRTSRILERENFYPSAVFFDPELSGSLSETYFSAVVLESLLSSVEGYLSTKNSLVSDTLLEKAFSLAYSSLEGITTGEKFNEFIPSITGAGILQAMAFSTTGRGSGTAIAYAVNGRLLAPKVAVTAAIILPILGHSGIAGSERMEKLVSSSGSSYEALITTVKRFVALKNFSLRLQELGIGKEDCAEIAATASVFPFMPYFPILNDPDELFAFLEALL